MDYRFYCQEKRSLLWFKNQPIAHYWDEKWTRLDITEFFEKSGKRELVLSVSKRFLKPGAKILEGGCGLGKYVQLLNEHGYDAVGVDMAHEAIAYALQKYPDLPVKIGNVAKLDFPDDFFDGYWSLGVIEHDIDGFQPILSEMNRVIKRNGYLFLMFPFMSPLRNLKVKWSRYPIYSGSLQKLHFYQYYYNDIFVLEQCENIGFQLVTRLCQNPYLGLISEWRCSKSLLEPIFHYRGKNRFIRFLKYPILSVINLFLKSFCANTVLLVLKKANSV